MQYNNFLEVVKESVEFPIQHGALLQQVGDVELTPPEGDSITISELLMEATESEYHSAKILNNAVIGNLDDRFIGRKYYDDRAGNDHHDDPRCSSQRSF